MSQSMQTPTVIHQPTYVNFESLKTDFNVFGLTQVIDKQNKRARDNNTHISTINIFLNNLCTSYLTNLID